MSLQRVRWASNNLHISEAHRNEGISLFLHQSVLLLCLQPLFVSPPLLSFSLPFSPNWWICGVVKTHANETAGITQTMWPVKVGVGSKTRCSREPSLHTCTHTLPHSLAPWNNPSTSSMPPFCAFIFFLIWKKKRSGDDNRTKSGIFTWFMFYFSANVCSCMKLITYVAMLTHAHMPAQTGPVCVCV